ncbi:exported hypothetical protein [Candidatus Desulfarcum epimagneticum]|uniref:Lipoprotein n=1 Tax=uncultured Desulfobacteraceae bacterium TaxID=218296 RepID=A0A484HEI8_9BACT|nr:exported hypothetical protein [uncultured Desulfobacteraceae bacterium]
MKKIILFAIIFCFLGCATQSVNKTDRFKAGTWFHHAYFTQNHGKCDILVTKVTKSWYSENAKKGLPGSIKLVKYRPKNLPKNLEEAKQQKNNFEESIDSRKQIESITYDVDFTLKGGEEAKAVINFLTNEGIDDVIHSSFSWEYEVLTPNCNMSGNTFEKRSSSVYK